MKLMERVKATLRVKRYKDSISRPAPLITIVHIGGSYSGTIRM